MSVSSASMNPREASRLADAEWLISEQLLRSPDTRQRPDRRVAENAGVADPDLIPGLQAKLDGAFAEACDG